MVTSVERSKRRVRNGRDIIAVLLLSITAVLTAWCGFESSKWGGEMSIAFSEESGARIQAAAFEPWAAGDDRAIAVQPK